MPAKQLARERQEPAKEGVNGGDVGLLGAARRAAVGVVDQMTPGRARAAQGGVGNEGVAAALRGGRGGGAGGAGAAHGGDAGAASGGGRRGGGAQAVGAYQQQGPVSGGEPAPDGAGGGDDIGIGGFSLRGVLPFAVPGGLDVSVGKKGLKASVGGAQSPVHGEITADAEGVRGNASVDAGGVSAQVEGSRQEGLKGSLDADIDGTKLHAEGGPEGMSGSLARGDVTATASADSSGVRGGLEVAGTDGAAKLDAGPDGVSGSVGRGDVTVRGVSGPEGMSGGVDVDGADGKASVEASESGVAARADVGAVHAEAAVVRGGGGVPAVPAAQASGTVALATGPAPSAETAAPASAAPAVSAPATEAPAAVPASGGGGSSGGMGTKAPGGGKAAKAAPPPVKLAAGATVADTVATMGALTPSQQARSWTQLNGAAEAAAATEVGAAQAEVPVVEVAMEAKSPAKPAGGGRRARGPSARKVDTGAGGAVPRASAPPKTILPAVPRAQINVPSAGGDAQEGHKAAKKALGSISTRAPFSGSPGRPPKVPKTGAADPGRAAKATQSARTESEAARQEARASVLAGRGPEVVAPVAMDASGSIDVVVAAPVTDVAGVGGMEAFVALGLPADVEAQFDADQSGMMSASFAEAQTALAGATTQRDTNLDGASARARSEADKASQAAQAEQDAAVLQARGEIDGARTDTLAAQDKAVAELHAEVGTRQQAEVAAVDAHVAREEGKVQAAFTDAERKATAEVRKAEADADRAKREEEEKSRDASWWDRACDVVADAVKAIADVVKQVFDAVRATVTAILDGVKAFANDLIDAAVAFVTEKLRAFGDWLKSKVTQFVGAVFPSLAAKLNDLIDASVEWACAKVEELGQTLKDSVASICDTLNEAVNTVLDVFQGAIEVQLAFLEATVTGDWSKFLLAALQAALRVAGIPEDQFTAIMGKAEETISLIVNDPGAFVGNIISAVGLGFQQFGDHILTHLKNGFFSWLTGAAAGAGLPTLNSFELKDIFVFVLETLGVTKDTMRAKLSERVGEKNTARMEKIFSAAWALFEGGWDGLWEWVKDGVTGLYDLAFGKLQEWIAEKVVQTAVTKVASMFSPVGAIVQAVITAWDVYTFLRDKIQEIWGVVSGFIESVSDVAHGVVGPAATRIEGALAGTIPLAIDILARILNLDGLAKKIQEFVEQARAWVDNALNTALDKIVGFFSGKASAEEPAAPAEADSAAPADGGEGNAANGAVATQGGPAVAAGKPGKQRTPGEETPQAEVGAAGTKGPRSAQAAAPASPAGPGATEKGAGKDVVETPVRFTAGGENHRLWVALQNGIAVVMVASTPMPVEDRVQRWRGELSKLPKTERQTIGQSIGRAIGLERDVKKLAESAATKDPKAVAALQAREGELAGALGTVFDKLPETLNDKVAAEDTLGSEGFKTFTGNYTKIAERVGTKAPANEARDIWLHVQDTLRSNAGRVNALPKGEGERVDLAHPIMKEVMGEFAPVLAKLEPAMAKLEGGSSRWAFWSGSGAMDAAKAAGGATVLESSALGSLFDKVELGIEPTIPLWTALSDAYAGFAAQKMSERDYLGFVGPGSNAALSVYNRIEKPKIDGASKDQGFTPRFTFYAVAVDFASPRERGMDARFANGSPGVIQANAARDAMVETTTSVNAERGAFFKSLVAEGMEPAKANEHLGPDWKSRKTAREGAKPVEPKPEARAPEPAPAPKPAAPNPGLRKEDEGTSTAYTPFKGEPFVKGTDDAQDVDPNDVKQGALGNCYMLGGMAAVARANPDFIRKLIKDNKDGTYDVTLYIKDNAFDPKGKPKTVTVDSAFPSRDGGSTPRYSKTSGDSGAAGGELWVMLLEKAWAVHKGTYTKIEGGKVNDDGKFGGAIALLTNLKEGYYVPERLSDRQVADMIKAALDKKMPVACDSKNLDSEAPDLKAAADKAGVVGNHAYAPKSVDTSAMTIDLQNPWGSSHVSGLPIADFRRFYRGLRIGQ